MYALIAHDGEGEREWTKLIEEGKEKRKTSGVPCL
jgi:hypothetical protein